MISCHNINDFYFLSWKLKFWWQDSFKQKSTISLMESNFVWIYVNSICYTGYKIKRNTTTVYKIGEWTISCILIFVINVHIFRKECICAGHYIYTFSKYMYFSSECYLYNTFLLLRLNRRNNGICNQFNLIYMDCTYGLLLKHSFISQFQMDGGDLFDTLQTYF